MLCQICHHRQNGGRGRQPRQLSVRSTSSNTTIPRLSASQNRPCAPSWLSRLSHAGKTAASARIPCPVSTSPSVTAVPSPSRMNTSSCFAVGGQMTQRRSDPAPVQVKHPLSSTCNVPTSDSLGPEIEPRETLGRPKPPRALHPASSTPATAVTAAHRTGLVIGRPFRWGPPRGPWYHRAPGRGLGPRPGSPLGPSSHAGTRVPLRFRPSSRPPHLAVRRLRGRRRGLATPPHRRRYGGDTQRDGGHGWPRDCQDPVQVGDLPPVAHHGDEHPPECESPTNSRPEPRTARSADWVALTRRRIRASAPTAARVARSARDSAAASATEIPVAPTPTTRTAPTRISMAMSRSGSPKGDLVVPVSVSMAGGPGTALSLIHIS